MEDGVCVLIRASNVGNGSGNGSTGDGLLKGRALKL
jgi:hypothetical protein